MAENKKSFLLYTDLLHTFEGLTDNEAGELIKHLLRYVNDQNPQTENRIVKIVFEPIKQQLKRDLKKYEVILEKRSAAGKKSAELRQTKSQQVLTSVDISKKCSTLSTDNVNDSVNEINNKVITPVDTGAVDFKKFINLFNSYANRKFKVNDKIKKALIARRKDYSSVEIKEAISNAHLDRYHIETGFKYLTPEFILRSDKLERFLNQDSSKENTVLGYTPQLTN